MIWGRGAQLGSQGRARGDAVVGAGGWGVLPRRGSHRGLGGNISERESGV